MNSAGRIEGQPVAAITRRGLLKLAAAGAALQALAACSADGDGDGGDGAEVEGRFLHGVASGDPLADGVILWTRVTPPDASAARVACEWTVYEDAQLQRPLARGSMPARADADWCVKVDLRNLEPGRSYWYRFRSGAALSPVGRTRSAPAGAVAALRFAFVTCSDYTRGYFHVYRRVAERDDLAAVVHLGDYIYENDRQDGVRPHLPAHELLSLADYRQRYAQYREDPDLQALHAAHPMIWVWDDHEVVNNAWSGGAENHDPASEGDYLLRRATATQVAHEWLPIRAPQPQQPLQVYRSFAFGDLVDLVALDTRHIGRDAPVQPNSVFGDSLPVYQQTGALADPARQLLGAEQEAWLLDRLGTSRATWRLIANQVIFSPLVLFGAPRATQASLYLSADKWDGFPAARDRVLAGLRATQNVVFFTGDAHESYAFDVTDDPHNPQAYRAFSGEGAAAAEFVVPSTTSRGDQARGASLSSLLDSLATAAEQLLPLVNPHLKFFDNVNNGYVLAEVSAERLAAEFWFVPMVSERTDEQSLAARFEVRSGIPGLRRS